MHSSSTCSSSSSGKAAAAAAAAAKAAVDAQGERTQENGCSLSASRQAAAHTRGALRSPADGAQSHSGQVNAPERVTVHCSSTKKVVRSRSTAAPHRSMRVWSATGELPSSAARAITRTRCAAGSKGRALQHCGPAVSIETAGRGALQSPCIPSRDAKKWERRVERRSIERLQAERV